jgi:hypothetical protein
MSHSSCPPRTFAILPAIPERSGGTFVVVLVALLVAANWLFFREFMLGAVAAGLMLAVWMRGWRNQHPTRLPYPPSRPPTTRLPQLNMCAVPVGGDGGGLLFAVGSIVVIVVGVPDLGWYFLGALVSAALFACALYAWHARHTRRVLSPTRAFRGA